MNPCPTSPRNASRPAGFALVVSLTMLVLLTTLAVGLLGLSAVSVRNATVGDARAVAQANARLGLMLAIGELQRELGPDPRITAPSAILDTNPQSEGLDGVSHGHLTGVWEARRDPLGRVPDYSREPTFRRWLVSDGSAADETKRLSFATGGTLSDPVIVVEGSDDREPVMAGRIPVGHGRLAWWVGDENQKALANPKDLLERNDKVPVANLLAGFATPGPHGVQSLAGLGKFPSNSVTSDKAATFGSLGLAHPEARDAWFFHDISPYPRSVLTNVTTGSLRKDLSLYLERADIDWREGWGRHEGRMRFPAGPLGPNGRIALSNPDDHDVMAWKTLHHWYHMHRQQLGDSPNLPLRAMLNTIQTPDPIGNPAWNSAVTRLSPVMVRMQMLISVGATRRGTTNEYDLRMHSYPVITLWNPYNVPLTVIEWSTFLHTLPLEHTVFINNTRQPITAQGSVNGNYNWGWPAGNMTLRVGGSTGPSLTFAPGEAKMLTYTRSESGGFNAHDMAEQRPAWLPTRAGQPRNLGVIRGNPTDRISIATALATWDTSSTSYAGQDFQTTFDFRCEPRAVHSGHGGTFQRQMFCAQVGWRHEPSNPRVDFISKDNFPSMTLNALSNNALPFLHLDVRLKALDEPRLPNKTWLHNIPFHPYAAITSTDKHRRNGVDAATTFFAHPYTIAFEQVNGPEGVFQNRPFMGASYRPAGQDRIVAAPVPLAPLTSLAQLQNLPLLPIEALNWSGYYFQNNAIGNSYALPALAPDALRERSFPFHLGQYFPWEGGDISGNTYQGRNWFNNGEYSIPGAPANIVDRSYVANHLLFDEYFFSSMAAQEGPVFRRYGSQRPLRRVVDEFYQGTTPLPVAAYQRYLPAGEDPTTIADMLVGRRGANQNAHLKSAGRLMVEGGFNINSTSVPAWTAVLSAANLKRPVNMPRGNTLLGRDRGNFVISRNPNPSVSDASEASRWLGYRELTEEEIHQLAEAVVRQVKQRGPFRSLGEFVNRRLSRDKDLALYGALQAALEDPAVDINRDYRGGNNEIKPSDISLANYRFPEAALGSRYQGTPAYISQADLLTPIAPIIQARSDTFLIRSYGEARTPDGSRILARAWCEAVIQRLPDYLDAAADVSDLPPGRLTSAENRRFGRRFTVVSFRWLPANPEA
jgi:hypothetical protein